MFCITFDSIGRVKQDVNSSNGPAAELINWLAFTIPILIIFTASGASYIKPGCTGHFLGEGTGWDAKATELV